MRTGDGAESRPPGGSHPQRGCSRGGGGATEGPPSSSEAGRTAQGRYQESESLGIVAALAFRDLSAGDTSGGRVTSLSLLLVSAAANSFTDVQAALSTLCPRGLCHHHRGRCPSLRGVMAGNTGMPPGAGVMAGSDSNPC